MTHWPSAAVALKYCSKPIALLSSPATSHALTMVVLRSWDEKGADACVQDPRKAEAQVHENNNGTTAGDGPEAKGLSHGRLIKERTAMNDINLSMHARKGVVVMEYATSPQ